MIFWTWTRKSYRIWFLPTSGISNCGISRGKIISVNWRLCYRLFGFTSGLLITLTSGTGLDRIMRLNFSGVRIMRLNFSGLRIIRLNFSGLRIIRLNFSGLRIMRLNFSGVRIMRLNFSGVRIMRLNFSGVRIIRLNFSGLRIIRLNFSGLRNIRLNFWCERIIRENWYGTPSKHHFSVSCNICALKNSQKALLFPW